MQMCFPFASQVCRRFKYLGKNQLLCLSALRLITSLCPFFSMCLLNIRDTDSGAVCHSRQSLACSVETDCHLGLDSAMRFAKWWHKHPLKSLRNVFLLSVPFDPFPTPPLNIHFLPNLALIPGVSFLAWILWGRNQLTPLNVQKALLGKHLFSDESQGGGGISLGDLLKNVLYLVLSTGLSGANDILAKMLHLQRYI